ncbi:hypothetical protein VTL71DRAFT_6567 [Oculimacula yallundae]|uniref:Uncharacterized protein n=1 Tax=Oculimacula yallundae TaxID=86028 RepID=A0ABR4BYH1_9HELO
MESTTNRTTFTITQPWLGAPLQFNPALGSKELEDLVDIYVIGNASKHEKMSVVTVEFFNLATVDLNTGALTRTYEIFPFIDFEQSPMESQSSGFSPRIFTPSPASSATFADSGYGSFSIPTMTPPTRTLGSARVTKKAAAKKAIKKVDEVRLPGFSIMTKDGIDVTTTAGRGTKTKEQREHAHLMRIMKACDACKKKKIRCDPSHRRPNDAARASTSDTPSSTGSAHISPQSQSSPGSNVPALSRQSTQMSTPAAFTPTNPMEDFVLFPEDASWNPEMSQVDLGQYNFSDFDLNAEFPVQNDFPFYQQPFSGDFTFDQQLGQPSHQQQSYSQVGGQQSYSDFSLMSNSFDTPGDLYELDQNLPVPHSRPHPSVSTQNSDQMESSQQIESSRANLSVFSMSQHASDSGLLSSTSDWTVLESSLIGDLLSHNAQSSAGPASLQRERVSSSRNPLSSDRSRIATASANANANDADLNATLSSRNSHTDMAANAPELYTGVIAQNRSIMNIASDDVALYGSGSIISVDPSDPLDVPLPPQTQRPSALARSKVLRDLNESCQRVAESLQTIQSTRSEYTGLNKDLQRLRSAATVLQTRQTIASEDVLAEVQAFQSQLDNMSARLGSSAPGSISNPLLTTLDPDYHAEYFRQCQVQARRLVRSLCATINTVQAQKTGTHVAVTQTSTLGLGVQQAPHASLLSGASMWTEGTQEDALEQTESFSYTRALLQVNPDAQRSLVLSSVNSLLPLIAVIAVLASFVLCSKFLTSIMTSSLAFSMLGQGFQYLTTLRQTSNYWIGNDVFSIAKLALFVVMAAQFPAQTKSNILTGGLTLFRVLDKSLGSSRNSRTSSDDVVDNGDRRTRGFLSMMENFRHVVTV